MNRVVAVVLVAGVVGCGDGGAFGPGRSSSSGGSQQQQPPSSRANGTLGEWRVQPSLNVARANFCAATVAGQVVVVGGNHKPAGQDVFVTTDLVETARPDADGNLGAWVPAGITPGLVRECTAVGIGNTLLLVDGIWGDETLQGRVWSTTVHDDGTIDAFTEVGVMPEGVRVVSKEAYATSDALLVVNSSSNEAGGEVVVLRAPLTGTTPGAFESMAWLPGFRGQAQYAFTGTHLLQLGGYLGANASNAGTTQVDVAAVTSGTMVTVGTATQLPSVTMFGEAVAVDGHVFVVGGKAEIFGAGGVVNVWSAPMGDNGELGSWSSVTPLPEGRTNHEVVVLGEHLYVLGGALNAGGLDTVTSVRVRFAQ